MDEGKALWGLGALRFRVLGGPFDGLWLGRQAFGADVNLNNGAVGDTGGIDALDLPGVERLLDGFDEVDAFGVAKMAEIDEQVFSPT